MKNDNLYQRKVIANNIKKLLDKNKMNQKELSEKIGIKPSTLSDYMNLRATPSHGVIQKIADVFGVGKSDIDTTYKHDDQNEDPDIRTLNRAARNMTPEQRKKAIEILGKTFEDLFNDEN